MSRKNVKNYTEQNAAGHQEPPFGAIRSTRWCTPGMGVNLWGESPLYMNPVNVKNIDTSTSQGKGAHVLLQTVAKGKNQSTGASKTGYVAPYGHLSGNKPQRTVATIPDAGYANGHDQRLAQGSKASICQRAVGSLHYPATAL